ncbi:uncharacterized protein LOC132717845 [Ruditapes philippinarum]|uniref:uncharacterized protein LOC132717845 n=1 Tax=Ruditapes philippinarum TaxID=129788 RepID=UPI00295BEB77|nr:uncharacterized protein LOC132717845 [Ruditapes philippinarum]
MRSLVFVPNVLIIFAISLPHISGSECDLTGVDKCAGSATDLVPTIYFNPASSELLSDIKENYCGKGLEQCLQHMSGNCSLNALAPYQTLTNTINLICRTDIVQNPCLARGDLQHGCSYCFQLFKVVVDNVVGDTSLTSDELNAALCRAYYDVKTCCMDAARSICDTRAQAYVATLLSTTTRANRNVLGC